MERDAEMIPRLAIVRQQLHSDGEPFNRFGVFAIMDKALSLEQRFRTGRCATCQEHDQNNRAEHTLQLNDLRAGGHTVYVRLGDAFPSDGWGGWLARVKLVMERG